MRLLEQKRDKTGLKSVKLRMDDPDDMLHAYNLINRGDIIKTATFRKIKEESKTGSVVTKKRKINITLRVTKIDYDPETPSIRISGVNIVQSEYILLGQHHSLELALNIPFILFKKEWDLLYMEKLDEATNPAPNCHVAAVVMEEGLASLCLVSNSVTLTKSKIEMQIPRKRKAIEGHDKALEKFFELCSTAISTHINFETVKTLLIASPGFVKDQFVVYLKKKPPTWFDENNIVLTRASSGHKHSLNEVLEDPAVKERLSNAEFAHDFGIVEDFFKILSIDPNRAVYSLVDSETACNQQAIDVLILADSLLRTRRPHERQRIVSLVKSVRENGGQVRVISSLHISGERLMQLNGIAAILRFPIYDLQQTEEGSSEDEVNEEATEEESVNLEELGLDEEL
jgi:protein pelota